MKLLIVYPSLSHPIDSGNRQWVMSQVESFKKIGHEVFMVCINIPGLSDDKSVNKKDVELTRDYWGDHGFIFNGNFIEKYRQSFIMNYRNRACSGYFKCDDIYPERLTAFIKKLHEKYKFDACIVNYYWLTKIFDKIDFKKKAVNTHDVFAFRDLAVKTRNPWMCTTADEEAKGLQRAQYVFALQDEESHYFSRIAPTSKVDIVYCPFKIYETPPVNNHNLIILSSGNHYNLEGFQWFCEKVYPGIIEAFPDVNLVVGGSICAKLQYFKNKDHYQLLGPVDNPYDLYKYGDVSINPCLNGTGLKIKTFESLAYGKIAMTHPHSTIGIYKKSKAPVFASSEPREWVKFLMNIWNEKGCMVEWKKKSIEYVRDMNQYILETYQQFLEE